MRLHTWLAAALVLLYPTSSWAILEQYTMSIDNVQEQAAGNCLLGSTARGRGTATLDTATLLFSWNVHFGNDAPDFANGMLDQGAEISAHFHEAPYGVNGPVRMNVGTGNPKAGSATLSAANAAALQAGNFYLNIHSGSCGAGEIRGQVTRIPPSAIPALPPLALGVVAVLVVGGGVALLRRRAAAA